MKNCAIILLLFLFARSAQAQTFSLERQPCAFTPKSAAITWWSVWNGSLRDTLIAPFVSRGFKLVSDGAGMTVSFDSVKGQGGARRVLLTVTQKRVDSCAWYHYRYADVAAPDSISPGGYHNWKLSSTPVEKSPTSDSTFRVSSWFAPFDGTAFDALRWAVTDSTIVQVAFWKVTGSPTLHYGATQRALLKVRAESFIPATLDSLVR